MRGNIDRDETKPLLHNEDHHHHHVYKLYTRRWFVLAVVAMFNLSNAMIWITFAPITNYTASYFQISETAVNYFSLVYFILSLPFAGISWWTIETAGLRFSLILGCIVTALGGVLRVVGAYALHGHNRFDLVLIGQILAGAVQPFVLSMPTKVVALWFSDHERTKANTLATMANPLGVLLANGIAAGMVHSEDDIGLLLIVIAGISVLTALMALFGVWSSKPPTPPSASALIEPVSFFVGIKAVLKNKQFLLLSATSGMGIAAFSSITTIVQQLICPKGYDDTMAGIIGALIIVGGFIGAGLTGYYVDSTRKYIHLAKMFCMLYGLTSALSLVVVHLRHVSALLYVVFALYGFSALGVLPVFLELGVECTYPVDEATSSGVQWLFGQVVGSIMFSVGLAASPKLTSKEIEDSVCAADTDTDPLNFSMYAVVITAIICIFGLGFVMFFDTDYKRLNAEHEIDDSDVNDGYGTHPNTEDAKNLPTII